MALSKSKQYKKQLVDNSNCLLNEKISNIDSFNQNIILKIQKNELNNIEEIQSILKISDIAKNQLEKGGSNLTKFDLIRNIILFSNLLKLDKKYFSYEKMDQLKITDLTNILRSILYDIDNDIDYENIDITDRIKKIDNFNENIITKIKKNQLNNIEEIQSIFKISEIAKNQLERGGSNLTKFDLITDIVKLSNLLKIKNFSYEVIKEFKIIDLINILRSILYDINQEIENDNNKKSNKKIIDEKEEKVPLKIKPPKSKLLEIEYGEKETKVPVKPPKSKLLEIEYGEKETKVPVKPPKSKLLELTNGEKETKVPVKPPKSKLLELTNGEKEAKVPVKHPKSKLLELTNGEKEAKVPVKPPKSKLLQIKDSENSIVLYK